MVDLAKKARDYFEVAQYAENIGKFDVAATNYFKSLAALNDFVLSKKKLFPKDHNERFFLLKENEPLLYRIASSLFLTYRRAYTKDISKEELEGLKQRLQEAFKNAGLQ